MTLRELIARLQLLDTSLTEDIDVCIAPGGEADVSEIRLVHFTEDFVVIEIELP